MALENLTDSLSRKPVLVCNGFLTVKLIKLPNLVVFSLTPITATGIIRVKDEELYAWEDEGQVCCNDKYQILIQTSVMFP